MKNLNTVQINDPKIGPYTLILTDEQLKYFAKSGADNIKVQSQNNKLYISPDSQTNNQNGFIGNNTEWQELFPNEENKKIPELIEKATKWEENLQLAITTLSTLVASGIGTYIGSGKIPEIKNLPITNIAGPFIDMYAENNPEKAKYIKNALEMLDKVKESIKNENETIPEPTITEPISE